MWEFLLGGIFRLVPEVFRLYEGDKLREHEIKMLDKQLDLDKLKGQQQIDAIKVTGEVQIDSKDADTWLEAIKAQGQLTGNKFIDGWNASIRPLITTWNVIVMYTLHKCATMYLVFSTGTDLERAIPALWTTTDYSIMMSIIGFWFVDRSLRKQQGT